ncbi:39S ribosomal protein L35, mitochondrial [Neodiprion fabricii]|uniref:39S ribosomal protein L35, mitochondrial n=1 Tax=Neodiprion fabricii TaxID=2872261 RepID=UPI001ED8EDFB|nr:39S ribosomal protein L35, mitochondrial [Neodiprion fabricii]
MLRIVGLAWRAAGTARAAGVSAGYSNLSKLIPAGFTTATTNCRCFSALSTYFRPLVDSAKDSRVSIISEPLAGILLPVPIQSTQVPVRTLTKFSLQKGKRKCVKAVIKRFYRLNWGCWIRTKTGRHKKLWKKSPANRRRLRQHVFVNATQSWLLDTMVTNFWRRPRFYVNDPYTPYHSREEFIFTRTKPSLK